LSEFRKDTDDLLLFPRRPVNLATTKDNKKKAVPETEALNESAQRREHRSQIHWMACPAIDPSVHGGTDLGHYGEGSSQIHNSGNNEQGTPDDQCAGRGPEYGDISGRRPERVIEYQREGHGRAKEGKDSFDKPTGTLSGFMSNQVSQDEDGKLKCNQPPGQGIKRNRGNDAIIGINPLANPKGKECSSQPGAETTITDQLAKPHRHFYLTRSL
jgi:hypothetical protein